MFGGSFDPVHLGHLLAADAALRALGLAQVRLVPAGQQPFKRAGHAASPADRLAMLQLAVAGDPRFVVDDRELRRLGPSYTVDTLRELRTEFPGAELCLLLGSDAVRDLPQWREADVIATLATVVELTRPGVVPAGVALLAQTLPIPAIDISATAIRERVARGEDIRYLVPAAVARYIAERRLYAAEG